jgi:hypothetical protein
MDLEFISEGIVRAFIGSDTNVFGNVHAFFFIILNMCIFFFRM